MSDDDSCEWVNVSSGTGSPGTWMSVFGLKTSEQLQFCSLMKEKEKRPIDRADAVIMCCWWY